MVDPPARAREPAGARVADRARRGQAPQETICEESDDDENPLRAGQLPGRLATGAYILHSGMEKWSGDEQRAAALHGMASAAYPFLRAIPPRRAGVAVSKDVWMLGTGLGLLVDAETTRRDD